MREPEEFSERDTSYLHALLRLSPEGATASQLARRFVRMIQKRQKEERDDWLDAASCCPLQPIRRFALGLLNEIDAVRAALQEPWSTAQGERQVTRLKYLKSQMDGRAKMDLMNGSRCSIPTLGLLS